MINYTRHILSNGLTLLVMEESSTPLVSVNTLFSVGARDENPSRTGFAHLFEHLMFGGTRNVPDFDRVVTELGGESNANTNNDFTQYYITLPANSLEEAFRLESDRMQHLDLSPKSLAVQQSVVTEEYHFRYMNRPYGDMWLLMRPLSTKSIPIAGVPLAPIFAMCRRLRRPMSRSFSTATIAPPTPLSLSLAM